MADAPVLQSFVPAVAAWFEETLGEPTPPQVEAWPFLQGGRDVLVAAPTGSGKTLAAFLAALDELAKEAAAGTLTDEVRVVYVSPLKALSNDVGKNLLLPLEGVAQRLGIAGHIRVGVRTGDTPTKERAQQTKRPPHVLVTTPESLYVLLGSEGGQKTLRTARTVILDEVHAVCGVRRGAHLSLSVERLDALVRAHRGERLQRVALSATQKPLARVASFVAGVDDDGVGRGADVVVVDAGHARALDLGLCVPESPLAPVTSADQLREVARQVATLVMKHRSTIVFTNTRRMAERFAARLDDELAATDIGAGKVMSHHGSMAKEKRLLAETRLKEGGLRVLVATASMELGIDVGAVDLVVQLGSTTSIAALLQRVGRAGHHKSLVPKGRLFPLTRDELVEGVALLDAVLTRDLDELVVPPGGLDVLGQHIIAAVAAAGDDGLHISEVKKWAKRAQPYAAVDDATFDAVVSLAVNGVMTPKGRRGQWLFHDSTDGMLRPRKGARLAALTSGGAIPDMGDYQVVETPTNAVVGTVNEDFAIELPMGAVFLLGTTSWRAERVERGILRVSNAHGQPATVPFWLGEAPGRTVELSRHVDAVRDLVCGVVDAGGSEDDVARAFVERYGIPWNAATQLATYLVAGKLALGTLPTQKRIVVERFEDSLGGAHIIFHAPFGARITRAWGLATRKRFCRAFDFELQAAATNDAFLLSVGTIPNVELAAVARFVSPKTARHVLEQAVLQAPMFGTRFRWNATRSLTVLRNRGGKRVPPGFLRIAAEDVLVSLFPDQLACPENLGGEREIPDDILVQQTLADCFFEAMDIEGLITMLQGIDDGSITVTTVERVDPSPLAAEIISARPYAFLDDAPLEERRVQAVMGRGYASSVLDDESVALDNDAIAAVLAEVHVDVATADEAWDALIVFGALKRSELVAVGGAEMPGLVDRLLASGRAVARGDVVVAAERRALFDAPTHELLLEVLRGRVEVAGPRPASAHFDDLLIGESLTRPAIEKLLRDGTLLEGQFVASENKETSVWSRRLVTRTRRRMLERLRAEIEPVSPQELMRFLFVRHGVTPQSKRRGRDGLRAVLHSLDGTAAPAAAWEEEILPARVDGYDGADLDALCLSGDVVYRCGVGAAERVGKNLVRTTALTFLDPDTAAWWASTSKTPEPLAPSTSTSKTPEASTSTEPPPSLSSKAQAVQAVLMRRGPSFFRDLQREARLLPTELEGALQELIGSGLVVGDGFAAVRALVRPQKQKERIRRAQRARPVFGSGFDVAGRFAVVDAAVAGADGVDDDAHAERMARLYLRRFGVVFRRLIERDEAAPPWRALLLALRRLEVRGDVRGGRFVTGFSGEQFALPEVVSSLRGVRRMAKNQERVVLSAADPLNLTGVILPGPRVPAIAQHRVLFEDGVAVAVFDHQGTRVLDIEREGEASALSARLRQGVRPFAARPSADLASCAPQPGADLNIKPIGPMDL